MELKYVYQAERLYRAALLIEPYGIEIRLGVTEGDREAILLIEPYGIEIQKVHLSETGFFGTF